MPASNTCTDKMLLPGGLVLERGTWVHGGDTTLTITADTSFAGMSNPDISDILFWSFASDGDTAVLPAKDVQANKIKITFTAGDAGDYVIIGKSV